MMKKIFIGNHEVIIGGRQETSLWKEVALREREEPPQLAWFPNIITEREIVHMESSFRQNKNPLSYFLFNESAKNLEEAFFSYYKVIEAAGGVVRNRKKKVLMMFRRGKWDLPKGKIDKGETIRAAAKREVMEETGIKKLKIISKIKFLDGKQDCTYHTYLLNLRRVIKATHWFEMISDDESPLTPQREEGITEVGWFTKKEIRENLKNSYRLVEWVLEESGVI